MRKGKKMTTRLNPHTFKRQGEEVIRSRLLFRQTSLSCVIETIEHVQCNGLPCDVANSLSSISDRVDLFEALVKGEAGRRAGRRSQDKHGSDNYY